MDMMVVLTEIQWQTLTVVTFIWKIRGERLGIRSGPDQILWIFGYFSTEM